MVLDRFRPSLYHILFQQAKFCIQAHPHARPLYNRPGGIIFQPDFPERRSARQGRPDTEAAWPVLLWKIVRNAWTTVFCWCRWHQYREGYEALVETRNKEVVTALREIAAGKVMPDDKSLYNPLPEGQEAPNNEG